MKTKDNKNKLEIIFYRKEIKDKPNKLTKKEREFVKSLKEICK